MITKVETYTGTVDAAQRKSLHFDREYREIIDGNTRRQELTGGLICKATYEIDGTEVSVTKVVSAAQVLSLTISQIITAADALLAAQLGV